MGRVILPHLIFTKIFGIIIIEREKEIKYHREEEFLKMRFHVLTICATTVISKRIVESAAGEPSAASIPAIRDARERLVP